MSLYLNPLMGPLLLFFYSHFNAVCGRNELCTCTVIKLLRGSRVQLVASWRIVFLFPSWVFVRRYQYYYGFSKVLIQSKKF